MASSEVRAAGVRDLPELIAMCAALHQAAKIEPPFDPCHVERCLRSWIVRGNSVVMVVGNPACAMLALTAQDSPLLPIRAAVEMLLWVDPAHRRGTIFNALIIAAKAWSRDHGCTVLKLTVQHSLRPEALRAMLRRHSFIEVETSLALKI